MKEIDLVRDAELAVKELDKEKGIKSKKPFAYLLVPLLLLLIILMVVPYYGVTLDPEPKNIPSLSALVPENIQLMVDNAPGVPKASIADYKKVILPDNPNIRLLASKITTQSCNQNTLCYAKSFFYFTRNDLNYLGDPPDEYLESPFETLQLKGADCDGLSIFLANLALAIGIPTRLVFIPGHVFVQVKLDTAPRKYKEKDGWISLDPACKTCDFGELHYSIAEQRREFLYLE